MELHMLVHTGVYIQYVCDPVSKNQLFSQKTDLLLKNVEILCITICVPHKNFMHVSTASLHTKIKLESINPIHQWTHLFMESK